jgi:prophage regulatory protein
MEAKIPHKLLRIPEVLARLSISRSTLYILLKTPDFPKKVVLGQASICFVEREIDAYIESVVNASRGEPTA